MGAACGVVLVPYPPTFGGVRPDDQRARGGYKRASWRAAYGALHSGRSYYDAMPTAKTKVWISFVVSFAAMAEAVLLSAGTTDYW